MAARTQISKPEYALITVAVAQKLTGSKTATPTAKQIAEAQKQTQAAVLKAGVGVKGGTGKIDKLFNKARNELSGITGMAGNECSGLWDDLKSAVVKAAPALPFVGPAAGLLLASAPLIAASQNKKRQQQQQQKSAAPQQAAPDDLDPMSAQVPQISGEDIANAYRDAEDSLIFGESIANSYRDAEDSLIFGEGGGAAELGAARRRRGRARTSSTLGDDASTISPIAYRLAVLQHAKKLAGGAKPATKHLFFAQKNVDKALSSSGISVSIPGAAPGRVTR